MITIRKALAADIPALVKFQQQLALETENLALHEPTLRLGMQALIEDPHKGFYNIAEDNGVAVGCHMITYEWSDWRNGMVWWLQSVYVIESYRSKGVFRQMYENVIRSVQADPSLCGLRLYVDKSNTRAMKVYAAMGMNGEHYTVYEAMKP